MTPSVVPAGTFTIRENDDAHAVSLPKPFMLGTYEVTQGQYQRVMGTNPSKLKGANNPVEMVSWTDAVAFCRTLSELPSEKFVGNVYRLPTEAEWEYACRVGTTSKYSFGDDDSELGDHAWFRKNFGGKSHPAGGKKTKACGLYEMNRSVWEWCQDWYGGCPGRALTNPSGANSSSDRYGITPSGRYVWYGFRVCQSSSGK